MLATLVEVQETVETWPQLGSAVTLGGAVTTDVARRVLLGQLTRSGRFYVDLEALIRDGDDPLRAVGGPPDAPPHPERLGPHPPIPRPRRATAGPVTADEVQYVVGHGILAPSGGNMQPWRFEWSDARLRAYLDPSRTQPVLDFEHRASILALGAAAENMDLAARELGLRAELAAFPDPCDPLLVFELALWRDPSVEPEPGLFRQVPLRVTNRRRGRQHPLEDRARLALLSAAASRGASLALVTDPEAVDAIGAVLGRGDRIRMLDEGLHREMISELRRTSAEVLATRDGIDLATLELTPLERAAMVVLTNWGAMTLFRRIGGGRALERPAREAAESASAIGLLTRSGPAPSCYLDGGRAAQRVWLTASAHQLWLQPWTVLPYLFARLDAGGEGLAPETRQALIGLQGEYLRLLPRVPDHSEILLFRIMRSEPPSTRSLRRPLDQVLIFKQPHD
jgi:hypothetical protein